MRRPIGTATSLPAHYRYHAFISYSHAADGQLAPALQAGLLRFAKPWYRVRALSIFRDNESLSASPHLWTSIQEALDASEFFILLASPTGAQSPWVEREAQRWSATKPNENLLIALTEGELLWDPQLNDFDWQRTNALPASLRGVFDEEPRFVDLRWARNSGDLDLTHPRFRDAVADLAAPLHHQLKADIASEEVRQHKHTIRVVRRVVVSLVVLTVAAVIAGLIAINARSAAIAQKISAQSSSLSARSSSELTNDFDDAGLLGAQAYSLDATDQSRSQVVRALEQPTTGIFRGHVGQVNGVSFNRNGNLIASVGQDGTLRLWDVAGRHEIGRPRSLIGDVPAYGRSSSESGNASAVAFSPTSQLLATASVIYLFSPGGVALTSESSTLTIWVASGSGLRRIAEHFVPGRQIIGIAFSPNGSELATASDDGSVQLWAPTSLSLLATPAPSGVAPQPSSVSFSPDGKLLAYDANSEVRFWDIATSQPIALPVSPNPGVISFDPTNAAILAIAGSGDVELWDVATGRELSSYKVSLTSGAYDIAFSPDGGRIGVAVADQVPIFLLDIGSNFQLGPVETVAGASDRVYQIAFNHASSQIVTANEDGTVRVFTLPGLSGLAHILSGSVIRSETGVGDNTVAAINSTNEELDVWDLKSGAEQQVSIGFHSSVSSGSVAVSPDGERIAVADVEGGIHVLSSGTGRQLGSTIHGNGTPVALSSTGLVAAPVRGGSEALFETSSPHRLVATLTGSNRYGTPEGAAFSPDGTLLAVSFLSSGQTFSDRIAFWNARTHQPIGRPLLTTGPILQLAFNRDGSLLGTSSNSGKVQLWNVRSQRQVAVLADDESGGVSGIAFSPNGSTVAAVVGCSLELWNPASHSTIGSLIDLHYVVSHGGNPDIACGLLHVELGFAANGALVVNLEFAGPIYVWSPLLTNTSSSIFTSSICSIVGRSLSPSEFSQELPGEHYHALCSARSH